MSEMLCSEGFSCHLSSYGAMNFVEHILCQALVEAIYMDIYYSSPTQIPHFLDKEPEIQTGEVSLERSPASSWQGSAPQSACYYTSFFLLPYLR